MTEFNANLQSLFRNFVNNKVDGQFKNETEQKLLETNDFFSFKVSGAKDLAQKFIDGLDVDEDGKVSAEEKEFTQEYKDVLIKSAVEKMTIQEIIDSKLQGEFKKFNDDGSSVTVTIANDLKTVVLRDKSNKMISRIVKEGSNETEPIVIDPNIIKLNESELKIENGSTARIKDNGTLVVSSDEGKVLTNYDEEGNLLSVIKNYGKKNTKPSVVAQNNINTIVFENEEVKIDVKNGETVTIGESGFVYLEDKNGFKATFDKDGLQVLNGQKYEVEFDKNNNPIIRIDKNAVSPNSPSYWINKIGKKDDHVLCNVATGCISIISNDNTIYKKYDIDGTLLCEVANYNSPKSLPRLKYSDGNVIEFAENKFLEINDGSKVTIGESGYVYVTDKNGDKITFNQNGYQIINGKPQKPVLDENGGIMRELMVKKTDFGNVIKINDKDVKVEKDDTAVVKSDGTVIVTSSDNKTVISYDKEGNLLGTIKNYAKPGTKPTVNNGNLIEFPGNKIYEISGGDKVTIGESGYVYITYKNGDKITLNPEGKIVGKSPDIQVVAINNRIKLYKTIVIGGKRIEVPFNMTVKHLKSTDTYALISPDEKHIIYYNKDGNLMCDITNNNNDKVPSIMQSKPGSIYCEGGKILSFTDGDKVTINEDGTITVERREMLLKGGGTRRLILSYDKYGNRISDMW